MGIKNGQTSKGVITSSRASLGGWLLGLGLVVLSVGCAQSRWNWRESFSMSAVDDEPAVSSPDSLVGRIATLEALSERASSMDQAEATRHAQKLADELDTESPAPVKIAMVRCLGRLRSPSSVDGLAVALRDAEPDVRTEACRALSNIDSPRAMDLLSEASAESQDVDTRLAAVRGLRRFRDARAVQALGSALNDRDPAVQFVAMQSLEQATGQDLGKDVRRWKEAIQGPESVLASRDGPDAR